MVTNPAPPLGKIDPFATNHFTLPILLHQSSDLKVTLDYGGLQKNGFTLDLSKKKSRIRETHTRTLQLLDRIGPVGRFDEKSLCLIKTIVFLRNLIMQCMLQFPQ